MALLSTPIFKKQLKNTDVNHRLSVPTRSLPDLPGFEPGQNQMSFWVMDEGSGSWFDFHCYKRNKGSHSKPVFSKGWIEFVKTKGLGAGDEVTLRKMESPVYGVWYQISVFRASVRLFGVTIYV